MARVFEFLALGVFLHSPIGGAIECFHCAYIVGDNTTSKDCLDYNTTDISQCESSSGCIEVSYENPETGEYISFFLGCGTTECTASNLNGIEQIEYNSSYNNFTMRKTCCTGGYCNCVSSVCIDAAEAHENSLSNEETTESPFSDTTTGAKEGMVDCFHCAHIAPAGVISPECINHNTTEHVQCPGKFCMKLTQQYNGSDSFIVHTLDCGDSKCIETTSDGVERSSVIEDGMVVEKVTCCTGEYCNCKSKPCMDSINSTASTPPAVVETMTAVESEVTSVISDVTTKLYISESTTLEDIRTLPWTFPADETTISEEENGPLTTPKSSKPNVLITVMTDDATFTEVVTSPWTFPNEETPASEDQHESSTASGTLALPNTTISSGTKPTTASQEKTISGSVSRFCRVNMWIVILAFVFVYAMY